MFSVVPILLRPRFLTVKNRWLRSGPSIFKELLAILISLTMMGGVYLCTWTTLNRSSGLLAGLREGASITTLSLSLTSLAVMLFLSTSVASFNCLFMSRDLELAFYAPIKRSQFLLAKCGDVAVSSLWMISTFGLPALIACGSFFHAHEIFYLLAPILFILLFVCVVLAGMVAALSVGAMLPARRGQEMFMILFVLGLSLLLVIMTGTVSTGQPLTTPERVKIAISVASSIDATWLPPTLMAKALYALVHGQVAPWQNASASLLLTAAIFLLAMLTLHATFYHSAFAKAHAHHKPNKVNSRAGYKMAKILMPIARSSTQAIAAKEFKVFARDITHTVQLLMLLAICFIFLYSFKHLKHPTGLNEDSVLVWEAVLLLTNIVFSSLIIISICLRFVFPSVSIEGSAYWIMQASPLSAGEFLRAKCKAWLVPIMGISGVIYPSGAMALETDGRLLAASLIAGVMIAYGLVGLATGLGAVFAQFDHENATQVATSFGGLMFIASSTLVLLCDTLPLMYMFAAHFLFPVEARNFYTDTIRLYLPLTTLLIINILATALSLRVGRRALITAR